MRPPRVGLLALYVPFYEAIAPVREEKLAFAGETHRRLTKVCDVIYPGLVTNEDEAQAAAQIFEDANIDAVVVAPAVAVFGALGWRTLERLDVPVCIWNVQPAGRLTESYNIHELIRNSGGLGVQALANTLARANRLYRVVFSRNGDPIPLSMINYLEAARIARDLRRARFGRIGSVFPLMTDVQMNSEQWPGERIAEIGPAEFEERYRAQTAEDVTGRVNEIRARHVAAITDDELSRSARIWLALEQIVAAYGLAGGAFNCHGENCLKNPAIGVAGCYGVSSETSQGRPFSCTGDLPTAIAMWVLSELAGAAIYGELDLVDTDGGYVLLANGGEGDFRAAEGDVTVAGNENFAGVHGRGAALRFKARKGATTLLSFTPLDWRRGYRMIAAEGEICDHDLPRLGVFHAVFRFGGFNALA